MLAYGGVADVLDIGQLSPENPFIWILRTNHWSLMHSDRIRTLCEP